MRIIIIAFYITFSHCQAIAINQLNDTAKNDEIGEFPILAWYSIPSSETSEIRYQELRNAGITHSLSFFPNINEVLHALDAAQNAGVKLIVSCPELEKEPETIV